MGIKHPNADTGAESDQYRESINGYGTLITKDEHDAAINMTTIEYIVGESDAPHIKYRLTLEPISTHTPAEYAELKDKAETASAQAAE